MNEHRIVTLILTLALGIVGGFFAFPKINMMILERQINSLESQYEDQSLSKCLNMNQVEIQNCIDSTMKEYALSKNNADICKAIKDNEKSLN